MLFKELNKMSKWELMKLFTQKILMENRIPGVICARFPKKEESIVFRKRKDV